MEQREEQFRKALESLDWEGMARAWEKADMKWHAEEWRKFVEHIRATARAERDAELREKIMHFPFTPRMDGTAYNMGWADCQSAIIESLTDTPSESEKKI